MKKTQTASTDKNKPLRVKTAIKAGEKVARFTVEAYVEEMTFVYEK